MTALTIENDSRDNLALHFKPARRSSLQGSKPVRRTSATGSTPITNTVHQSHSEPALLVFNETIIKDMMILGHHTNSEPKIHSLMMGYYEVKNTLKIVPKTSTPKESKRYLFYAVLFLFFVCNAVYDMYSNIIPFLKNNFVDVELSKTSGEMVLDVTRNSDVLDKNKRIMQETGEFIDDNTKETFNVQDLEVMVLKDTEERMNEENERNSDKLKEENDLNMLSNVETNENDKVAEQQKGSISPWYLETNNKRDLTEFSNKYYKKIDTSIPLLRSNTMDNKKNVLSLRNANTIVNIVPNKK